MFRSFSRAMKPSLWLGLLFMAICALLLVAKQPIGAQDVDGPAGGVAVYMPLTSRTMTPPTLFPVSRPNSYNQWTVSWEGGDAGITGYQVSESLSPDFSEETIYEVGLATSWFQGWPADFRDRTFYYRVRTAMNGDYSPWSNVESVRTIFYDVFDDDTSGWQMVRQDTDDVNNLFYYNQENNDGHYVIEINGRWDYGISSPLVAAPEPPYYIQTHVYLDEPKNLNSYGIIFGANWDGSDQCPVADYSTCFTHYYRVNVVWFGAIDRLRVKLTRIEEHDPVNNAARGTDLFDYTDVFVHEPPAGYQLWTIKVFPDGLIEVWVNDIMAGSAYDTTYIHQPYFGGFASSDEYLGAEPHYSRWLVAPILP